MLSQKDISAISNTINKISIPQELLQTNRNKKFQIPLKAAKVSAYKLEFGIYFLEFISVFFKQKKVL
ncbi:hypothetical protein BXU01_10770 [[Flexibacter] sp. ATCC 35103]|nr:hypothetical protein BXU01_10770 [[Flexibacter] sp. ATCC 35103]